MFVSFQHAVPSKHCIYTTEEKNSVYCSKRSKQYLVTGYIDIASRETWCKYGGKLGGWDATEIT